MAKSICDNVNLPHPIGTLVGGELENVGDPAESVRLETPDCIDGTCQKHLELHYKTPKIHHRARGHNV